MASRPSDTSYTMLGFQIKNFKFAVRIPKLKKPKLMKKLRKEEAVTEVNRVDWASDIQRRYQDELRRYGRQASSTSSEPSSLDSYDWIRDFHSRYNPVLEPPVSSAPDAALSPTMSDNPERTSTPLSLRIEPLNRMVKEGRAQARLDFHDMSGLKIYEDLEDEMLNSHGSSEQDSSELSDQSYEIVSVVDHRVIARAHFRPRTLKSSGGTLGRRGNLV